MTPMFYVRGRSVDGTVWAGPHSSWEYSKTRAVKLTQREAVAVIAARKALNAQSAPDDQIGRLTLVIASLVQED